MDWKIFVATFSTIFVAEIGDKTQIAALAASSQSKSTMSVWLGTVMALSIAGTLGITKFFSLVFFVCSWPLFRSWFLFSKILDFRWRNFFNSRPFLGWGFCSWKFPRDMFQISLAEKRRWCLGPFSQALVLPI